MRCLDLLGKVSCSCASVSILLPADVMSLLQAGFIKGAGGLCPLNCPGIENINLTSIIAGHFDYISKMEEILELVAIQSSR